LAQKREFVVTPDRGGGPRVSIFSLASTVVVSRANFVGIDDANIRGGYRAALGDVNHDGYGTASRLIMTFAQKLRELREEKGLSEVKLAAASGVSLGTVRVYRLGHRSPSFANVQKLAKALGVSCEVFSMCEDVSPDLQEDALVAAKPRRSFQELANRLRERSEARGGKKPARRKGKGEEVKRTASQDTPFDREAGRAGHA